MEVNSDDNNNNKNRMQTELWKLERKFTSLARKFTYTMHFYGFFQDMNLLLRDSISAVAKTTTTTTTSLATVDRAADGDPRASGGTGTSLQDRKGARVKSSWWFGQVSKWSSLGVVILANVTTIYFLAAHIIWELRRLDSRSRASSPPESVTAATTTTAGGGGGQSTAFSGGPVQTLGWTVLKEFLDNVRRHLSRLFSLALTISWHVSCHRIELLFIDCRHYYSMFYKPLALDHPDNQLKRTYQRIDSGGHHQPSQVSASSVGREEAAAAAATALATTEPLSESGCGYDEEELRSHELAQRAELLAANRRFYQSANKRVNLTILLPLLHFLFNVTSLSLFPSSSRRRLDSERPFGIASNHTNPLLALAGQAMDNFDSFHLSIHTAFHPVNHQIKKLPSLLTPSSDELQQQQSSGGNSSETTSSTATNNSVGVNQSALYCFIELIVYSVYFQGPRIVCATCLSLVLNIHYQCIRSLNRQLVTYIKRTRDKPMTHLDMISLVKQYDVIGIMHQRIEQVFKWSIVQWFSLMFLNCLMHIFSFTESTSAYVVGNNNQNQNQREQLQQQQQPQQPQQSSTSLVAVMVRLASMFFVCYPPYLIYTEAIRIESASNHMQVEMVRLSRRKNDPIAQAIGPDLFEPLYLGVGDFFHLSKKSMSSFMGAIVTFSVMFIEEAEGEDEADNEISDEDPSSDDQSSKWRSSSSSNEDFDPIEVSAEDEDLDEDNNRREIDDNPGTAVNESLLLIQEDSPSKSALSLSSSTSKVEKIELVPQAASHQMLAKLRERKKYKHLNGGLNSDSNSKSNTNNNNNGYGNTRVESLNPSLVVPSDASARTTTPASEAADGTKRQQRQQHQRTIEAPILESKYLGRLRENERLVELRPKLRLLNANQVEVCDFSLRSARSSSTPMTASAAAQASGRGIEPEPKPPFFVSWIDRVNGEAVLEANDEQSMNCELLQASERNFTFLLKAIGCNGLESNEALVSVNLEDVNEFSPEFERPIYSLSYELDPTSQELVATDSNHEHNHHNNRNHNHQPKQQQQQARRFLIQVKAHDHDCSLEFGSVCRYELSDSTDGQQQLTDGLSIDASGRIWLHRVPAKWRQLVSASSSHQQQQQQQQQLQQPQVSFQVLAHDCGGKKSQRPASVQITLNKLCRPALRDVDALISYRPGSGQRHPFARGARLDLCGVRCHRANISVSVELKHYSLGARLDDDDGEDVDVDVDEAADRRAADLARPAQCDRQPYSMVSRRRLCGARSKAIELLPQSGWLNKWTRPLLQDSRHKLDEVGGGGVENNQPDDLEDFEPHGRINDYAAPNKRSTYGPLAAENMDTPAPQERSLHRGTQRGSRPVPQDSGPRVRQGAQAGTGHNKDAVYRDQVYSFDGSSKAALVPKQIYLGALGESVLFGPKHTISFWMRHANANSSTSSSSSAETYSDSSSPSPASSSDSSNHRHPREHLLCATSDSFSSLASSQGGAGSGQSVPRPHLHHNHHNHHLYSVFVRNCKLILLMRRQQLKSPPSLKAAADNLPPQAVNSTSSSPSSNYWPTEWRWSLDRQRANRACDNKWHLFTLNVNYPNEVELYIDGEQFEENYDNLLIVDDLPLISSPPSGAAASANVVAQRQSSSSVVYADSLSPSATTVETGESATPEMALSVGGCWDWRQQQMSGHFRGQLAGLHLVASGGDDSQTIECMGQCQEMLVSDARQLRRQTLQDQQESPNQQQQQQPESIKEANVMMTNSLVSYQESQSKILLIGHDPADVEEALTQIGYLNKRQFPSSHIDRRRQIVVNTSLECLHSLPGSTQPPSKILVQPLKIDIQIEPSKSLPVILISGTPNLAREYEPFIQGIQLFSSVSIQLKLQSPIITTTTTTTKTTTSTNNDYIEDGEPQPVDGEQWNGPAGLEACSVRVHPPLNYLHESLMLPVDLLQQLGLYWRQSARGLLQIYGWDSIENFQLVLSSILYKNLKPSYYSQRVFKLVCSDMNGRLVSNEYSQTVTIIHLKPAPSTLITTDGSTIQPAAAVSLLRGQASEDNVLKLDAAVDEPVGGGKQQTRFLHHRPTSPISMLNAAAIVGGQGEPSTKLDRLAMAFLVFVISLIAIMLVIALTNLKEPRIRSELSRVKLGTCRHAQQGKLCNCPMDEEEDDDDDDNDDDEYEEEYEEGDENDNSDQIGRTGSRTSKRPTSVGQSHEGSFYADDDELMECFSGASVSTGGKASGAPSSPPRTNTDLESLDWDHEDEPEGADQEIHTTVVMNPLLEHEQQQQQLKDAKKSLVYVTSGPKSRKAKTHLSSLQRVGSTTSFSELVCVGDTSSSHYRADDCLVERGDEMIPMDEEFFSSSCSSSSLDEQEFANERNLCDRHRYPVCRGKQHNSEYDCCQSSAVEEDDDYEGGDDTNQYEIYHENHVHHECLLARRRQKNKQSIGEDDGQQPVARNRNNCTRLHED